MRVHRWQEDSDGPLSERAMREKLEDLGYSASKYVYPPGTSFDTHTHPVDKIDAVLTGRFRVVLEGEEVILEPGDAVEVPRGARHSAEVVGDQPVVSLDAIRA